MTVVLLEQSLNHQETALAHAMIDNLGGVALSSEVQDPDEAMVSGGETFNRLTADFANDPTATMASAREALVGIAKDESVPKEERSEKLSSYLDAYFDLTIKLDHASFPNDPIGTHKDRAPRYVPDGFVDMGRDPRHDPIVRSREQVWVDKRDILENYKPYITKLIEHDYGTLDDDQKALKMVASIARKVYTQNPNAEHADGQLDLGGDKVKLSEMNEVICRHRYLIFQTLTQTLGFDTRIVKGERIAKDGNDDVIREHHVSNMVGIGSKWYLADPSNPYKLPNASGEQMLIPTMYEIDAPLEEGESKVIDVDTTTYGHKYPASYYANDEMFWYVQHPQGNETQ